MGSWAGVVSCWRLGGVLFLLVGRAMGFIIASVRLRRANGSSSSGSCSGLSGEAAGGGSCWRLVGVVTTARGASACCCRGRGGGVRSLLGGFESMPASPALASLRMLLKIFFFLFLGLVVLVAVLAAG